MVGGAIMARVTFNIKLARDNVEMAKHTSEKVVNVDVYAPLTGVALAGENGEKSIDT